MPFCFEDLVCQYHYGLKWYTFNSVLDFEILK